MLTIFADLSPAEAVALSTATYAALSVPVVVLAPADLSRLDPRPLVGREVDHVKAAARDAAISTAALLMLLSTPETNR